MSRQGLEKKTRENKFGNGYGLSLLKKESASRLNKGSILDSYEIHLITGKKIVAGRDYFKDNMALIKQLIREGAIIEVVRITSGGTKETIYP